MLYARGKKDEAEQELKTAVALDPKRVESHLSLAKFLTVMAKMAEAEAEYKQAISANPNSPIAHTEYGKFIMYQNNRSQEAEGEFRKAVEVGPTDRAARSVLAGTTWVPSR